MKTKLPIELFAYLWLAAVACGQGTMTITFDGPPLQPPGTAYTTTNYSESGMLFLPIPHPPPGLPSFGRVGSPPPGAALPDNGSAYLDAALGQTLMLSFTNGSVFDLFSVDLAEYSTVVGPLNVHFVGYRHDGTTVTADFLPGVNFQTFYFDQQFSGLDRVELPNPGWSLDNLRVVVPEPSGTALLLLGASALGAFEIRRRRRKFGKPHT
jgi:hypothetical protein